MSLTTPEECQELTEKPYRTLLGSVMWGQLATRPNLSLAVSVLLYFQANLAIEHWCTLMHVMGYICNTLYCGLTYLQDAGDIIPVIFINTDYMGCVDTRRSTLGQVFVMAGAPVSWASKRQATISLSTVETKHIFITHATQQLKWMYAWMAEADLEQPLPGLLHCNNCSAVDLMKMAKSHSKVKHIDICHHYIHQLVLMGEIKVNNICGDTNPADVFTKALPRQKHKVNLTELNIRLVATGSGGVL